MANHGESQTDSDACSIVSDIFSDNECDQDSASSESGDNECDDGSGLDLESEDEDLDDEDDDGSNSDLESEDEDIEVENGFEEDTHDPGQRSKEEYLAKAKQLNVSELRQDRYSKKTRGALTNSREYWKRYCELIEADPVQQWNTMSDSEETVQFLYAYFLWRCDIRRGKDGRCTAGIKAKSSLETFWKNWHLVLKEETSSNGLSEETQKKVNDVIAKVATEKGLTSQRRPKANMFIQDVVRICNVLISTTEVTYHWGWERLQLLLYLQLASITASRPSALLQLRYSDLTFTLMRDLKGGRPKLMIYIRPEFTKQYLGKKALNEFKIPEIIFDPSLVLSPHVTLLSMMFYMNGFKRISQNLPALDCAEKLYSLRVLGGLEQQQLKVADEIRDGFVFCQVGSSTTGLYLDLKTPMALSMLESRLRRIGEITGIDVPTKPIEARYAAAKAFNKSKEISDPLQCVMMQHANMDTFIKHYEVDIDVDAQGAVRGEHSQTPLVQFSCSLSATIDPNRPYRLLPEESRSLNELRAVRARQDRVDEYKRVWKAQKRQALRVRNRGLNPQQILSEEDRQSKIERAEARTQKAEKLYKEALRQLKNEKQRQRNKRIKENLKRYREEQPVIDMQSQLAGMKLDTDDLETTEGLGNLSELHRAWVGSIVTVPGKTLEAEYQRRITSIDTGVAFCSAAEGKPTYRPRRPRRWIIPDEDPAPPPKRPRLREDNERDAALRHAIQSVQINHPKQRPTVCFLCVGNPKMPLQDRIAKYATPGSLTRHFMQKHLNAPWPAERVECHVCKSKLIEDKKDLVEHAEACHGTVVRGSVQKKFILN